MSAARGAAAAAAVAWLSACQADRVLAPRVPAGAVSAVILFDTAPPRAVGLDLGAEALRVVVPERAGEAAVAFYDLSLAEADLPPGDFNTAVESPRLLPPPFALLDTTLDGAEGWMDRTGSPPRLFTDFRVRTESVESCVRRGGCVLGLRCEVPCQPADPQAPTIAPFPDPPRIAASGCPLGWSMDELDATALDGATLRVPICEPGALRCSVPGTYPFIDGCAALDACPPSGWPDVRPGPGVVFVAPSGAGDGSDVDHPMRSLEQAVNAGASRVVLSRGAHEAALVVSRSVELVGACAAETRLVLPNGARSVLDIQGGQVQLAHLSLEGGAPQIALTGGALEVDACNLGARAAMVIVPSARARVKVRASAIAASSDIPLRVFSSSVSVEASVLWTPAGRIDSLINIDGSSTVTLDRSVLDAGALGQGLVSAGRAYVRRSLIANTAWHGVFTVHGSRLFAEDLVVRDLVGTDQDESRGNGVLVEGAEIDARRLLIRRVEGRALTLHLGSEGRIEDYVADTVRKVSDQCTGLYVRTSRARVTRYFAHGVQGPGLWAAAAPALATAEDLVIVDGSFTHNRAIQVDDGGTVDVRRAYLARASDAHIALLGTSTRASTFEDVVIEGGANIGLWITDFRAARLTRARFKGVEQRAIKVGDPPGDSPELIASDVRIEPTGQIGLQHTSGRSTLSRFWIEGAAGAGVALQTSDPLELSEGVLRSNRVGLLVPPGRDARTLVRHVRFQSNETEVAEEQ